MKNLIAIIFVSISILVIACSAEKKVRPGIKAYVPESKSLHDTIVMMDSILFEAYNTCKLYVFEKIFSEDIEFYHDRGGLSTSKKGLIESLKNNICGKVSRELLKGSIEVYNIPGYGAIQMGAHRFHNNQEKDDSTHPYSKFVHTWKRTDSGWQVTRVISLH